jgi:hypothetical protein
VGAPNCDAWVGEGLAGYIEDEVAERTGGKVGRLFTKGGNRGVDAEALAFLKTPNGKNVLSYIGGHGEPPALSTDRVNVGPAFNVLSQSFCKFLVERVGLPKVIRLHAMMLTEAGPMEAKVERLTGRPADTWRREWLTSIGYSDAK